MAAAAAERGTQRVFENMPKMTELQKAQTQAQVQAHTYDEQHHGNSPNDLIESFVEAGDGFYHIANSFCAEVIAFRICYFAQHKHKMKKKFEKRQKRSPGHGPGERKELRTMFSRVFISLPSGRQSIPWSA